MTTGTWLEIAVVIILVLVVGLLGASEVSITRMSLVRAYRFEEERRRGSSSLVKVAENPASYLNVVLLLTLLSTIGGSTMATSVAVRMFDDQGVGEIIATVIMTLLLFVFADVTPKTFAIQQTDRVALALAPLIVWLQKLVGPAATGLVRFANVVMPGKGLPQGPFITEGEIRHLTQMADEAEVEQGEKELIHSIFEFGDTVVREVMVPRPDVTAIEVDSSLRDVQALVVEHGYSRIPVYEDDLDKVVGIIFAKDVLKAVFQGREGTSLRSIVRPARFVPESKKVAELLREMQAEKFHVALATDEYGSVSGLIALEDLLEELVGEIADEYDPDELPITKLDEDRYRVDGKVSIDEIAELFEMELPEDEWDTIAGFVLGLLGSIPDEGEEVSFQNLRFQVEKVQARRIESILITRTPPPEPEPEDEDGTRAEREGDEVE